MVKLGIVSCKSYCSISGTKKKCLMLFHAILKERVMQWITSRSTLGNNHIGTLHRRSQEVSAVEEDSGWEPRTTHLWSTYKRRKIQAVKSDNPIFSFYFQPRVSQLLFLQEWQLSHSSTVQLGQMSSTSQ